MPSNSEVSYDVAIVGGGAAGSSAALVLGRARREVLLCDMGSPRNGVASEMHGFISRDGTSPGELLALGRQELAGYPSVRLVEDAVVDVVAHRGEFQLTLASGNLRATRRLLLATGVVDALPEIDGLRDYWGKSAFVCPYCDGWEVRDRPLVVCGSCDSLVGMAQELYQWSRDITICGYEEKRASDLQRSWIQAAGIGVRSAGVRAVKGTGDSVSRVELEDGERIACQAIFVCASLKLRGDLAARLGCALMKDGMVEVDGEHRTSVAGCYAAGDMLTKTHQVIVASASGVKAAIALNDDLTRDDVRRLVAAPDAALSGVHDQ